MDELSPSLAAGDESTADRPGIRVFKALGLMLRDAGAGFACCGILGGASVFAVIVHHPVIALVPATVSMVCLADLRRDLMTTMRTGEVPYPWGSGPQ